MTTLLIIGLCILFISNIVYLVKYKSLDKKTKDIISELDKPLRRGYIQLTLTHTDPETEVVTTFYPNVYVKEIDRFTNGECELEIEKIEPGIFKISSDQIEQYIKTQFHSVHKITNITWLESEVALKEMRKNKLEKLKSIIGK
jgi:hypothetical protein